MSAAAGPNASRPAPPLRALPPGGWRTMTGRTGTCWISPAPEHLEAGGAQRAGKGQAARGQRTASGFRHWSIGSPRELARIMGAIGRNRRKPCRVARGGQLPRATRQRALFGHVRKKQSDDTPWERQTWRSTGTVDCPAEPSSVNRIRSAVTWFAWGAMKFDARTEAKAAYSRLSKRYWRLPSWET